MRNLLAFLAAMTLTLLGIGWYLGWYHIRRTPAPEGHRSVTVDINTRKISQDLLKAEQRIQKKLEEKARTAQKGEETSSIPVSASPPANVGVVVDP